MEQARWSTAARGNYSTCSCSQLSFYFIFYFFPFIFRRSTKVPLDFEAEKRLALSQTCHTVTAAKATPCGVKAAGVNSAESVPFQSH